MNNSFIPFTYLIGWSKQNLYYYGVRYANKSHPKQLWSTYFTSSKYVKSARSVYGEPDVIQIRKTFKDKKSAIIWESKVLRRMNMAYDKRFINLNQPGENFFLRDAYITHATGKTYEEIYGTERATELRLKRSENNFERWQDPDYKQRVSNSISKTRKRLIQEGLLVSDTSGLTNEAKIRGGVTRKNKFRNGELTIWNKGFERDNKTKEKISNTLKNKPMITCPHCGKSSNSVGNMKRHHFDRCKRL